MHHHIHLLVLWSVAGRNLALNLQSGSHDKHETFVSHDAPRSHNKKHQHHAALVLQLHGKTTDWDQYLITRYSNQLKGSGIQFALLYDVSKVPADVSMKVSRVVSPSGQAEISKFFRPDGVHTCRVNWTEVESSYGEAISSTKEATDAFKIEAHQYHGPFLTLWWSECARDAVAPETEYIWFVEPDAFFTGNVMDFLQQFSHKQHDYIAGGFRVAGKHWWQFKNFLGLIPDDFTFITNESDVVENLGTLPTLRDGDCQDVRGKDTEGVLFAQDHVVRMSSRLLSKLRDALRTNMLLIPSEVWAPTVCAALFKPCTAFDFAPILEKGQWTSPVYCWEGDPWNARCQGTKLRPEYVNKWVHPVKTDHWAGLDCTK
jgi:hypothetical protein